MPPAPWTAPTPSEVNRYSFSANRELWTATDAAGIIVMAYMLVAGMGHKWPGAPFDINEVALDFLDWLLLVIRWVVQ